MLERLPQFEAEYDDVLRRLSDPDLGRDQRALRDLSRRRKELETLSGPQSDVAWGSQIRSYVLAPYQLVKDLRTGFETGNVEAVLDGDLYDFMIAYLRFRREHEGS